MVKGTEAESESSTVAPSDRGRVESSDSARIGFIGLGIMGQPMAFNILRSGYPLTVYARTREATDQLVAAGAVRATSPAETMSASDILITMLPGAGQVESVLFGPEGLVSATRPGQLIIDMSSVDPADARNFAQRLADVRVDFLDAPVSGGESGATEGTLSIMVGGTEAAFARAIPVLSTMGARVVHVGESGTGQIAKACNQLVVLCNIQAVAEALVLAERAGASPEVVRRALLGGFADSRVLQIHGERMIKGDFRPGARSELHQKDAQIIRNVAQRNGVRLNFFEVAADYLEALVAGGGGALDHAALYTVVKAMALDHADNPNK